MNMQREGAEGKDYLPRDFMGDFHRFGSLRSQRSMLSSLFGDRDPFDDPFFTRPLGSMFESSLFNANTAARDKSRNSRSKGLVIQEIFSNEQRKEEENDLTDENKDENQNNSRSSQEPSVEHAPDDGNDECQIMAHKSREDDYDEGFRAKASRSNVHTCKVTYGGVDGAYYTSTRTRRRDNEGVLLEETREADKTTGQAIHRISRGIHDKGHSVTRKLNSDGQVDTVQTLHNLNEDELAEFNRAWRGNFKGQKHVSHMDGNAGCSGSRSFPSFAERMRFEGDSAAWDTARAGTAKKVVRINID